MFECEPIFSERNANTGLLDWYFSSREGVVGPFSSKELAKVSLDEFRKGNTKKGAINIIANSERVSRVVSNNYLYR